MDSPIRILNVVGRMDRGGIETFIMNLYRNIDRSRIQFDFLAHYGKVTADYNEEIRALGGRIYEMPVIKTTEKTYPLRYLKYRRALIHFFKSHPEYHIVHGHMTNTAAIYMPIAKKYGQVKCTIAHSHLTQTQKTVSLFASIGTNILRFPIHRFASDYFACSEAAAMWLFSKKDLERGKVKIIPNGIESEKFVYNKNVRIEKKKELGLNGETIIGHVGRFFPQKNHTFIVEIFSEYHKLNCNSILLLIGTGELRSQIEVLVNKYKLTKSVKFLGVRTDIAELMQTMDIFLMPSLYEGLPVVGIEAQASGLPLLVSKEISTELDITGNVWFMKLNQPAKHWADKIMEILNAFRRTNVKDLVSLRGYDIKSTADQLQEFYLSRHFAKTI